MSHKLMIKTHNKTGLKYLCYTQRKNHNSYKGSGKYWKRHLKEHGDDFSTELIFESDNYDHFIRICLEKSLEFDVVNSKKWANLRPEDGNGGDTVSSKRWITNGSIDKYWNKNDPIPEGWIAGRSKCIFNDPQKQSEFSLKADREKQSNTLKKLWADGTIKKSDEEIERLRIFCSSDNNPSKSKEAREKISKAQKAKSKELSARMKQNKVWEKSGRWKP